MVGKKSVIGIWNLEIKVMQLNAPTNDLQVGGTTCNTAILQHINACVVKIDGKRVKNDDKRNDAQENVLKKCNSE